MKPKVIIIRGPGTNCELETKNAFEYVGANVSLIHVNNLLSGEERIDDYDILVLPGGFSYGDDISAGKILSVKIKKLFSDFGKFINSNRPLLGICNGFQVLVKSGFIPENKNSRQTVTLATNNCGHFICAHVELQVNKKSACIFTKGLPEKISLPIAHGEGKFVASNRVLSDIKNKNLDALTYIRNPNGSAGNIAGLCNEKGNCFGLMPHPERNFLVYQSLCQRKSGETREVGWRMFKNAVDYVK